jgi:hypothetical protein
MNIIKCLAIAAALAATLAPAKASPKMPAEFVGQTIGETGEITPDGIGFPDSFCTPLKITRKWDRSIYPATQTPPGVWVYTITLNCKDESDSGTPDEKVTYKIYWAKGEMFVNGKGQDAGQYPIPDHPPSSSLGYCKDNSPSCLWRTK